ncbi:hypothetical protein EVAR_97842_1 [Eumeta japonica]|uniref:Uncharacterized protein n=1 Tax=Eumeta variegata TaxID=151549 RepID=A0A4C1WZX9_EUMVA|nr:hypothetical protein EVAR_97842_1 [Eumeta japonica]
MSFHVTIFSSGKCDRCEKEVENLLKEMRASNVFGPASSLWYSPMVLIKKEIITTRFYFGYCPRRLKDTAQKDSLRLPRIVDTLDTLHDMKWFSTMNLKSRLIAG